MKQLIRQSIEELLGRINAGNYKGWSCEDLAEQRQIDDEMVYYFIYENHVDKMDELGIISDADVDAFCERIVDVLNSEWYEDTYQEYVDYARQGLIDQRDWEQTKQTLRKVWNY